LRGLVHKRVGTSDVKTITQRERERMNTKTMDIDDTTTMTSKSSGKTIVNLEVRLKSDSSLSPDVVSKRVPHLMSECGVTRYKHGESLDLSMLFAVKSEIARDVKEIKVEIEGNQHIVNFFDAKLRVFTYVIYIHVHPLSTNT